MKIKSIEVFCLRLPFRVSFGHHLATRKHSDNVVVRVCLEDGSEGWGESIPREYVTGEDQAGAVERIKSLFAPEIMAHDLPPLPELAGELERMFGFFELEKKRQGASWCALEIAVLDAVARSQKSPLAQLLGPPVRDSAVYGAVVPFASRSKTAAILIFYRLYGFTTVKIKVGADLDEAVARLRLARKILGTEVKLRIDANCAWSVEQTLRAAELFAGFGVISFEQPVAADDLDGLAAITASIQQEVVADESLCTLEDARRLIERRACSSFNIRVSKVGGILQARKIAALARAHGIRCHLGAQVGESGILSAAGRLLACVEERFENCEGSDNLLLLKQDLTRENLTVGPGGKGKMPAGPGLGVVVLPGRVDACTESRHTAGTNSSPASPEQELIRN